MKNLKKMLSVLSAVMVMSTCAVSAVYADESLIEPTGATESTNHTEPTEPTNEKITDIKVICDMINEEMKKEIIPGKAKIDSDNYPDCACVCLDAETGNSRFQKWIENFIKEKNIDSSKAQFIIADIYVTGWVRDVNGDDKINVRDCAFIASKLAKGEELSDRADYNSDGKVDVRDTATLAKSLA
ncbi:MAG: dockerin type I repeat-containing protein [Porcipelethomonas sp.]